MGPKAKTKQTMPPPDTPIDYPTPPIELPEKSFTPAEQQSAEISKAIRCADGFLGLMKFDRAADRLEEQLLVLGRESSPLRYTDQHVDLLVKYGGVLWWDEDFEGSIDAFTAGDEILEKRPSCDCPELKRRRAEISVQIA